MTYSDNWATVYATDALEGAKLLKPASVHCIVTSPPYWGLRSYLPADDPNKHLELGAEPTPEAYVERIVEVFRALRPALRGDGTLWLNLGDSFCSTAPGTRNGSGTGLQINPGRIADRADWRELTLALKPKDLVGIPWMVAFALRADGWYLRSDIIWHKPSCMPESVTDRPTKSHEYIFLFSKSPRYFFDQEAVREKNSSPEQYEHNQRYAKTYAKYDERSRDTGQPGNVNNGGIHSRPGTTGRNIRSVWNVATKPFSGSHYACFPPELIYPCIKAGTSEYGCCSNCLSPWTRVVEVAGETTQDRAQKSGYAEHANAYGGASQNLDFKGSHWKLPPRERTTTGWRSSCTCNADTIRATVLDPFMGSGTTAYAARKLGRRAAGFDLDARNLKLIEERLGCQEVLL